MAENAERSNQDLASRLQKCVNRRTDFRRQVLFVCMSKYRDATSVRLPTNILIINICICFGKNNAYDKLIYIIINYDNYTFPLIILVMKNSSKFFRKNII